MRICVVSQSFPTKKTIDYIFVEQLCRQFVEKGHEVTVIAPQSITKCLFRHIPLIKTKSKVEWENYFYMLFRPWWLSFGIRFSKFFPNEYNKAVMRVCKKQKLMPDIFYGHFWAQIYSVYPYAKKYCIPLTGAVGEESISIHKNLTESVLKEFSQYIKKVIAVSTKSKDESINAGLIDKNKVMVIPNAINDKQFYPRDKKQMRQKYGFSEEDFIVAFVGQFNERKGVNRLCEALSSLNDEHIKALFIGKGLQIPTYTNVLFSGAVQHDKVPEYLSCADVFALPTTNEGCSNAIIEAMACGLPIISSNMSFNWDVLNNENSIMVDPYNIKEIAEAIKKIKDNPHTREELAANALETASGLSLSERADKILGMISTLIIK